MRADEVADSMKRASRLDIVLSMPDVAGGASVPSRCCNECCGRDAPPVTEMMVGLMEAPTLEFKILCPIIP
jgi:hypothetical protein